MRSKRGCGSGGFTSRSPSADHQNPRLFFMNSGGFRGRNHKKSDFSLDFCPQEYGIIIIVVDGELMTYRPPNNCRVQRYRQ